jgi:prepilin-type processing-associated H-X9-DG protein
MFLLCVAVSLQVRAADPSGVLGSLIDDQTLAMVRVDVQRIDLDALINRIQRTISDLAGPEALEQAKGDLENARMQVGARQKGFVQAGGRDLYAVVSMNDLPYFLVAIPASAGNQAALLKQVQDTAKDFQIATLEIYSTGDLILVGRKETIERFKKRTPVRSDVVAAAFQACAGRTVQAVLIPNADQNRVLAEMLPQVLGGSGAPAFQGLRWAALGLDCPPSIALGLTVETAGPDSAEGLLKVLKDVYAWVGQRPEIRSFVQDLDQVLTDLTPRRQERRLVLNLDQTQADALIQRLVGPTLMQAREKVLRFNCASHLSQVGKAILMYASDHKDQIPPDLQTLMAAGTIPEGCFVCPLVGTKGSYVYRGAGLNCSLPPNVILVHDKAANHNGQGRNVLFLDSHVDWTTESQFQDLIRKDNEARRKAGLPESPAD